MTAWRSTRSSPATGHLTLVEYEPTRGKTPRNFAVDPTGSYVLAENQGSGTIVVFRVDPETGALEPTGQTVEVPAAVLREVCADSQVTPRAKAPPCERPQRRPAG